MSVSRGAAHRRKIKTGIYWKSDAIIFGGLMQHAECPHAARHHRSRLKGLTILAGLASLIWFLVRVIPKPSRASYPCQRAAAPLASGFLIWFVGLLSFKTLYRRAANLSRGTCYALPTGERRLIP
jgi:hypothetical protein